MTAGGLAASPAPPAWVRAWRLVRRPRAEWAAIAGEASAPARVLFTFLLPMLLSAAAAGVVGYAGIGLRSGGFSYKLTWALAARHAAVSVGFALAYITLLAAVANALASRFGGTPRFDRAFAALAHAGSPSFLAALLLVWPASAWLWMPAAAWSIVVLHWGLATQMRPAARREIPYTAAVVAIGLLLLWLAGLSQCSPVTRLGTDLMMVELPDVDNRGGAAAGTAESARRAAEDEVVAGTGASGTVSGVPTPGAAGAVTAIPEVSLAEGADPLKGVLHGGDVPTTRSVLEGFLPGPIEGMRREVTENYAFSRQNGTAADLLSRGALVEVRYRPDGRPGRSRSLSIADLTPEFGPAVEDQLLEEIVRTGGRSAPQNGRVERTVTDADGRLIVTEFEARADPARQLARYEVLIGRRYRVTAHATGLTLDAVRDWVAGLDLAGLEARAKANRPVE